MYTYISTTFFMYELEILKPTSIGVMLITIFELLLNMNQQNAFS